MTLENLTVTPFVSIIVPTHKRPELLARALKSLQRQTYQNFEVIVVENGCAPEAEKVLESFREQRMKVRYLYDKTPSLPNARNLGIRAAEADLIAYLDDDDEWVPEKLEKQVRYLAAHPAVGLVGCRIQMTDENGTVHMTKSSQWSGDVTRKVLLEKGAVIYSPSCILVKKELCEKINGFDARYKYAHDLGFYFNIERHAPLFLMEEPLVVYHVHTSNMSNKSLLGTHDETVRILKKLVPESARDLEGIRNSIKRFDRITISNAYSDCR